ncbi:class I SAM-dependent methyltransferase [Desulfatiferula olefinivorans]
MHARRNDQWINSDALRMIDPGTRVVLFGAGQGSVDFIDANAALSDPLPIRAVLDNDPTMWGKKLLGIDILSPDELPVFRDCLVVITTISGKEAVAGQLTAMGLTEGEQFVAIGRYPVPSIAHLTTFLDYNERYIGARPGDTILHVGPGGFLGFECCLHALGFNVASMDALPFGMHYPDVTGQLDQYREVLSDLLALPLNGFDKGLVKARYLSLFHERDGAYHLDRRALPYRFPCRFSAIPFPDSGLDVIVSFGVLEHVRNPDAVAAEIKRVLKPGGFCFHRIITRDHRSFSRVSGYHPFSYLCHTAHDWDAINKHKFYQNRLLPHEWLALFERQLDVAVMKPLTQSNLDDATYAEISAFRPDLERRHLECVDCDLIAQKESA